MIDPDRRKFPADPDQPCAHEDFEANVSVGRISDVEGGPITAYAAEVRVWCTQCGEVFRWIGVPAGLLADRPTCSIDEAELRAPLRPASSDPDFGLGIPGFSITVRDERGPSDD